jgi:hypothetical protein
MRTRFAASAALVCFSTFPALAENPAVSYHPKSPQSVAPTATAVGTGVGIANSSSQSGAVAISGQGGQGGNSSLTVNNPANTTATVNSNLSGTTTSNLNQTVSGTTTSNVNSRVSGTTTVRSAPPIAAPGLSAAGLETCLGSASGGVSWLGTGITGGASIVDEGCQARLDSRTLASYGLKAAAVARLCQRADIWRSMPDVCQQYWPVGMPYPSGIGYAEPAGYTAPLPVRALMSASGGSVESIRVINGKTGVEGDCLNYSATKQKCYQWAGEPTVRSRNYAVAPTRSVTPAKPKAKPAPPSAVAKPAPETPNNDSPEKKS